MNCYYFLTNGISYVIFKQTFTFGVAGVCVYSTA